VFFGNDNINIHNDKMPNNPSRYIHPSTYGYDFTQSHKSNFTSNDNTKRDESGGSDRPLLQRKGHVIEESSTTAATNKNPMYMHPIFFNRIPTHQVPRKDMTFDESCAPWIKGEFTFMYNYLVGQTNSRAIYKQIGQGLALIEFEPMNSSNVRTKGTMKAPLPTGSMDSLIWDVQNILLHLKQGNIVSLEDVTYSHSKRTENRKDNSDDEMHLRIYPTVPMRTQVLIEFCGACLKQALELYCIERLYSAYNEKELMKGILLRRKRSRSTSSSAINGNASSLHEESIVPSVSTSDLIKGIHCILRDIKPSMSNNFVQPVKCYGLHHMPFTLSKNYASALHKKFVNAVLSEYSELCTSFINLEYNTTFFTNEDKFISDTYIHDNTSSKQVTDYGANEVWFDDNTLQFDSKISLLFGENFIVNNNNNNENDLKYLSDCERNASFAPSFPASFPLWLRKRKYSLEITINTNGLYIFYYNINYDKIEKIINILSNKEYIDIIQQSDAMQYHYYMKLGIYFNTNLSSNTKIELMNRLQLQISQLFWSLRMLSILYYKYNNSSNNSTIGDNNKCDDNSLFPDISPSIFSNYGIKLLSYCLPIPFVHRDVNDINHVGLYGYDMNTSTSLSIGGNGSKKKHSLSSDSASSLKHDTLILLNYDIIQILLLFLKSSLKKYNPIILSDTSPSNTNNTNTNNTNTNTRHSIYMIVPISRTSSLCCIDIKIDKTNYITVIYRAMDVKDIITLLGKHNNIHNIYQYLSNEILECLKEPNLVNFTQKGEYQSPSFVLQQIMSICNVKSIQKCLLNTFLFTLYFDTKPLVINSTFDSSILLQISSQKDKFWIYEFIRYIIIFTVTINYSLIYILLHVGRIKNYWAIEGALN
jgi:hypothetical protein